MIERVARALSRHYFSRDPDIAERLALGEREALEWLDWKVADTWKGFMGEARAAIEAMLESAVVQAAKAR